MQFKFKNLADLMLTFNTEAKCRAYLEQQLWKGKPTCPHCGYNEKAYKLNDGKTYKCANKECWKKYTVTVGTIAENSNIPLQKWFMAMYLFTAHKKGISSCQLARDLGIAQKTAWFMLMRIREVFRDKAPELLQGEVQADETYMGGKTKNMHGWQRDIVNAAGSSAVHMNPVFGLANNGKVRIKPVETANGRTLQPIIMNEVEKGAIVITDGHGAYAGLNKHFKHEVLNHEGGEYVRKGFHTNNIEGFWGLMKRGIYGIYHQTSGKHLERYCDEFAYRYNNRKITDDSRFILSLSQVKGRLTYKQLIAKNGNQESEKKSD